MQVRRKRTLLVDRDQIEWYPTLDATRCIGCKVCFEFCPKRVYTLDESTGKPIVSHPYECVVLCSGCVPKCPSAAISFPRRDDFEHFVRYESDYTDSVEER